MIRASCQILTDLLCFKRIFWLHLKWTFIFNEGFFKFLSFGRLKCGSFGFKIERNEQVQKLHVVTFDPYLCGCVRCLPTRFVLKFSASKITSVFSQYSSARIFFYYICGACNFFLPTNACRKFFFKITHPLPQELNGRPLKGHWKQWLERSKSTYLSWTFWTPWRPIMKFIWSQISPIVNKNLVKVILMIKG